MVVRNAGHSGNSDPGLIDRAIAALAGRQQGLITTQQLLNLGLTKGAIEYRTHIGRLHRLYRGIYAVGHIPVSPHAHALAAVLACGPDAVLSHRSAATLWGIDKHWRRPFEVTAPTKHRNSRIRTHRSKTLTRRDITRHFGIPVTTPARTLFDNAPRLTGRALARAVNELRLAGFLRLDDLAELLDRQPQSRSANRLLEYLVPRGRNPTRSDLERDFRAFVERYSLPEPLINTSVQGHEADVFFPEHKLVVECDGWETHSSRSSFESDRDRDAERLAAGIATVRVTKRRLTGNPEGEAARLHQILTARTSSR